MSATHQTTVPAAEGKANAGAVQTGAGATPWTPNREAGARPFAPGNDDGEILGGTPRYPSSSPLGSASTQTPASPTVPLGEAGPHSSDADAVGAPASEDRLMMLPDNFVSKVKRSDCLHWTGSLNSSGYGTFGVAGKAKLAHRVAYEALVGPIPEGMTIDHLCRVTHCVNVAHMEVVTRAENLRRSRYARGQYVGGRCAMGHELTGDNVLVKKQGTAVCRTCRREYERLVATGVPASDIRDWARANGYKVSPSGRLSHEIRLAYAKATQAP